MHNRYGTLSLSDILTPAIDLAANGFPVSHLLAKNIAEDPMVCEFPHLGGRLRPQWQAGSRRRDALPGGPSPHLRAHRH